MCVPQKRSQSVYVWQCVKYVFVGSQIVCDHEQREKNEWKRDPFTTNNVAATSVSFTMFT